VRIDAFNSSGPVCALLGLVILSGLVFILTNNREIDRNGLETNARVVHRKEEHRKNSTYYSLDLRYTARDGSAHEATRGVEPDTWDRARTDSEVAIKYRPSDPAEFILVGEPLGSLVLLISALAMFALAITCELLFYFLGKREPFPRN